LSFWKSTISTALVCLTVASNGWGEEAHERARTLYDEGRELESAGDLEGALERFRRADAARPTYRLHRHMGRVCVALGRIAEALEHYQTFLNDGGERVRGHWREEISGAIATLGENVGTLRISAPEGSEISIDGELVGTSPLDGLRWVDPGRHRISVSLEGHEEFSSEVAIRAGQELDLDVRLERTGEPWEPDEDPERDTPAGDGERRSLHHGWFWGTAGLSAAFLLTGGILGVMALLEQSRYDDLNVPDRTDGQDDEMQAVAESGRSLQISTDIMFMMGSLGAIATLVLAFFTDFDGDEEEVNVGLGVAPLGEGIAFSWRGAF